MADFFSHQRSGNVDNCFWDCKACYNHLLDEVTMQNISAQFKDKPLLAYFLFAALAGIGPLVYLLLIPTDTDHPVLFGFSAARLLLAVCLLLAILFFIGLSVITWRNKPGYSYLSTVLLSKTASVISLALFVLSLVFMLWTYIPVLLPNRFFFERLRPLGFLVVFVSALVIPFQNRLAGQQAWIDLYEALIGFWGWLARSIDTLSEKVDQLSVLVVFGLTQLAALPLLFQIAFQYDLPTGAAGLYTLMAEELAKNGFALPMAVPFYGPGGMPFAYPPAGFYLMALALRLFQIDPLAYLRFAPPLFMWLSLPAIFFITYEISHSRTSSVLAALVVGGAQRLFMVQGTAGGMVRGLAYLFALWGIYFFLLAVSRKSIKFTVVSGVLIGLTALSHLGYAEFAAVFVIAYGLTQFSKRTVSTAVLVGGTAFVLFLPWAGVMAQRYGTQIFQGAFQSHGNDYFLQLVRQPSYILPAVEDSLRNLLRMPLLWGLMILGMIYAALTRKVWLPLWFGLSMFFLSEGDRYLFTIGAPLAGLTVGAVVQAFRSGFGSAQSESSGSRVRALVFGLVLIVIFYAQGWNNLASKNVPLIGNTTLDLARYVRQNTTAQDDYLFISANLNEAEWFPYLFERTPLIASWGGEWIGTYSAQLGYLLDTVSCEEQQSWVCVEAVLKKVNQTPDWFITHAEAADLNQQIARTGKLKMVYQNEEYLLWQNLGQ